MPDRCFKDSGECYHDCKECNSYHTEITCPECGNEAPRSEIDRYDGVCQKCRLKEEFDNRELLEEFFKDSPEIKDAYMSYLDEGWNRKDRTRVKNYGRY